VQMIHTGMLGILKLLRFPDRLATGLLLREVKEFWPISLHLAHSFRVASIGGIVKPEDGAFLPRAPVSCFLTCGPCLCRFTLPVEESVAQTRREAEVFAANVYTWGLQDVWTWKKVVNVRKIPRSCGVACFLTLCVCPIRGEM